MAAITTLIAVGSLALGAATYVGAQDARKDAASAARNAEAEGKKIQGETRAQNAAQAAAERRSQIREERVRRARILQNAENTGVDASSGEFGALGALSTNLSNNIGTNLGRIASAQRSGGYAQNAADFQGQAEQSLFNARGMDNLFSLSGSIFNASGGFGTISNSQPSIGSAPGGGR